MLELSPATRRALRARAHALQPVVTIGHNGLNPGVLAEIERSLQAHELIKVRVQGADRATRQSLIETICERLGAAPVQQIGHILVLYRQRPEEKPAGAATGKPATGKPGEERPSRQAAGAMRPPVRASRPQAAPRAPSGRRRLCPTP